MKTFLSVVILSGSSLLAQEVGKSAGSEFSRLRQEYVESLNRLLQQYIKTNDVAAASIVSRELDKMSSVTPDTTPNMSPSGAWRWPAGAVITIAGEGIATNTESKIKGIWQWVDQSKLQFKIEWQDGYIDNLTISPDGTKLQGGNNADEKFVASRTRLPNQVMPASYVGD